MGIEICPKCKNRRVGKYEYCICGHKWDNIAKIFKDILGVDLTDLDPPEKDDEE